MNDVLKMAAADAATETKVPDDQLEKIRHFGDEARKLTRLIIETEDNLKSLKEAHRRIVEQDLPEAMDEVDMTEFKFEDGTKVKVSTFYSASIPEDRKDEAFGWLKENDCESLIKGEVKVSFSKGEFEIAQEFLQFIRGFNAKAINPDYKESVHWQTLRAFVRERVEEGASLPLDLFGVFIGRKAEIKLPK